MTAPAHRVAHLILSFLDVAAAPDREGYGELADVGIVLVKVAERNHGELVDAGADEEAGILLEDADYFVEAAVEAHDFSEGIDTGEQSVGNIGSNDHNGPRVCVVILRDEAAPFDGEYWFVIRTVDRQNRLHPDNNNKPPPELRVMVHTVPPRLERTIQRVYSHLQPGGLFIFDVNTVFALEGGFFDQDNSASYSRLRYVWRSE